MQGRGGGVGERVIVREIRIGCGTQGGTSILKRNSTGWRKQGIWHISAANAPQHGRCIFRKSEMVRKINLKEVLEVKKKDYLMWDSLRAS